MRALAQFCKNIPRIRVWCLCLAVDKRRHCQFTKAQLLNLDTQLQVAVESFRPFSIVMSMFVQFLQRFGPLNTQ